jgi:hypothetical protein
MGTGNHKVWQVVFPVADPARAWRLALQTWSRSAGVLDLSSERAEEGGHAEKGPGIKAYRLHALLVY